MARGRHDLVVMDELLEQIDQKWREMTEEQKQWYVDKAKGRDVTGIGLGTGVGTGVGVKRDLVKKPVPPYFEFSNRLRMQIKQSNARATTKEINCAVSLAWSRVSKEEKKRLQDQYNFERQKYQIFANSQQSTVMPLERRAPTLPPIPNLSNVSTNINSRMPTDSKKYLELLKNLVTLSAQLGISNSSNQIETLFQNLLTH